MIKQKQYYMLKAIPHGTTSDGLEIHSWMDISPYYTPVYKISATCTIDGVRHDYVRMIGNIPTFRDMIDFIKNARLARKKVENG